MNESPASNVEGVCDKIRSTGEASRRDRFETKMLNPKLETPAFAEAASRRQAKL